MNLIVSKRKAQNVTNIAGNFLLMSLHEHSMIPEVVVVSQEEKSYLSLGFSHLR